MIIGRWIGHVVTGNRSVVPGSQDLVGVQWVADDMLVGATSDHSMVAFDLTQKWSDLVPGPPANVPKEASSAAPRIRRQLLRFAISTTECEKSKLHAKSNTCPRAKGTGLEISCGSCLATSAMPNSIVCRRRRLMRCSRSSRTVRPSSSMIVVIPTARLG